MELSAAIKNRILSVRDNTLRQLQPYQEANRILIEKFSHEILNDEIVGVSHITNENLTLYQKYSHFIMWILQIKHENYVDGPVFTEDEKWVRLYIKASKISNQTYSNNGVISTYIKDRLKVVSREKAEKFLLFLEDAGFSFKEIVSFLMQDRFPFTNGNENLTEQNINGIGTIIKDRIVDSKSKSLIKTIFGSKNMIVSYLLESNLIYSNLPLIQLFGMIDDELIVDNLPKLLVHESNHTIKIFNNHIAQYLFKLNFEKYADDIDKIAKNVPYTIASHFSLALDLAEGNPAKYHADAMEQGDKMLNRVIETLKNQDYFYGDRVRNKTSPVAFFEYLKNYDSDLCFDRLKSFIEDSTKVTIRVVEFVADNYTKLGGKLLFQCLDKEVKDYGSEYYYSLFSNLKKVDFSEQKEDILKFLIETKNKKAKYEGAKAIMKYADDIKDRSISLLNAKTVGERLTGALILSNIDNDEIKIALKNALNAERNDETRNIMLESLHDQLFNKPMKLEGALKMIGFAEQRNKLSRWSDKWIDEEKLPKIYWNNGEILDQNAIRFILYRMKQVSGINSDVEAKQLIQVIDSDRSEKFALFLLQSFIDSNADSKFKYYLTLCGLLGNDNVLNKLHTLFRKSIADKRIKMAEYVLGAIAMIGSDKALRILEVISRKYSNKKPKLSQVALNSLDSAAEELNITKDQLADRIIPNFDFDGTYKEFSVGEEKYRAFIGSEFKLVYYNEDNKMRKSVPKGIDPDLKKEFAEIAKEVRDIVKSQGDRLERYMKDGRTWQAHNWKNFFFENPIMFVYAMKLIWLVEDEKGSFKNVFYCDEDTELYDVNDEEIEVLDTDCISILHPLRIDKRLVNQWKEKIYEEDIMTIFPILDRPIFEKKEHELESNTTRVFNDKEIPKGADFVAPQLLKRGWLKETGDGGSLNFVKKSNTHEIFAMPYIEGPAVWYQGGETPARIFTVSFRGKSWNDKIQIKDVPPVFYSEVMADLDFLIKAV